MLAVTCLGLATFESWPFTLVEPPGGWFGPVAAFIAALNFLSPASNLHSEEVWLRWYPWP